VLRLYSAVLAFDAHVRAREQRRREAHERRERDEEYVERVDEKLLAEGREAAAADDAGRQRAGGEERRGAECHVRFRRPALGADGREERGAEHRDDEQRYELHVYRSSRSDSR
jgi:hypothetical protein